MSSVTVVTTNSPRGAIVRTTRFQNDHVDFSWLVLALVAVALIAAGLRKLFWSQSSN